MAYKSNKRHMSAEARRKMSEGMKEVWAKRKESKQNNNTKANPIEFLNQQREDNNFIVIDPKSGKSYRLVLKEIN